MAETARSGAVPLPVVTPGKQKGFAADIQGFALKFSLDFLLLHLIRPLNLAIISWIFKKI